MEIGLCAWPVLLANPCYLIDRPDQFILAKATRNESPFCCVTPGAMYGSNTHKDDLYKNLFTDASIYINRERELSNDGRDQISIYNYVPISGADWALPNPPQAVRAGKT